IAAVSNEGRLLMFPVSDLPILPRGKGNKIMSISSERLRKREEFLVGIAVLNENENLTIYSDKRKLVLKPTDLSHYRGERGRRGNKLPRGFSRVTGIEKA